MIDWHRLFGIAFINFFSHLPLRIELEKDLSSKKQLLDVLVVRKEQEAITEQMPDGLGDLHTHNLLSYKSHQESLNPWALDELLGHYVNYRKQISPSTSRDLIPESSFALYGISTRFPQKISTMASMQETQEQGVYVLRWGSQDVRILVLNEMTETQHNALWLLFSANREKVALGANWTPQHSLELSGMINQLFHSYQLEGIQMAYTIQDFRREIIRETLESLTPEEKLLFLERISPEERLKDLPPEERVKGLPAEERVKGLPPEELLKGLPAEERLKGLPAEERLKGLPAEERLKGLPPEERLKGLPPEELLKGLPPEERLKGLDEEGRKALRALLDAE